MGEIIKFDQPYWRSFRLPDGKLRWFYTDEKSKLRITNKKWFNKTTTGISIHRGYETEENSPNPISETIYHISISYKIQNYFGDKSGVHFRSRVYMLVDEKLYKQEDSAGVEVKRMTKELKGALEELKRQKVSVSKLS